MTLYRILLVLLIGLFIFDCKAQQPETRDIETRLDQIDSLITDQGLFLIADSLLIELGEELSNSGLWKGNLRAGIERRRGFISIEQGQLSEGINLLLSAIEVCQSTSAPNIKLLGNLYRLLGHAYVRAQNIELADEYVVKSLKIFSSHPTLDSLELAKTLSSLGEVRVQQSRFAESDSLIRLSITIRREVLGENHIEVARGYLGLGTAAYNRGEYKSAKDKWKEALRVFALNEPEGLTGQSAIHYNMGIISNTEGDYEKAVGHAKKSLELSRRVNGKDNPKNVARLNLLAFVLYLNGDTKAAISAAKKAESICLIHHDDQSHQFGPTYGTLGFIYMSTERFEEALFYYLKAREAMAIYPPEHPFVTRLQTNIAALYINLHQPDLAIDELEAIRKLKDNGVELIPEDEARYYEYTAKVHSLLGNYNEAITNSKLALAIKSTSLAEPNPGIGTEYYELGILAELAGNYERAIGYFRRADMNFAPTKKSAGDYALCLSGIAKEKMNVGQPDSALHYINEALTYRSSFRNDSSLQYAQLISVAGEIHEFTNQYDKAVNYYESAISLVEADLSKKNELRLDLYSRLGRGLVKKGASKQGRNVLLQILGTQRKMPDKEPSELCEIYYFIARSYLDEGQIALANTYLDSTLNTIPLIQAPGVNPLTRRAILIRNRKVVDLLLDEVVNKKTPGIELNKFRLFQICDFLNQNELRENLRISRVRKFSRIPDDLILSERKIKALLNTVTRRIRESDQSRVDEKTTAGLYRDQLRYQQELNAINEQINQQNPKFQAFLGRSQLVQVNTLKAILGGKKSLVEYYLTPDRIYIFVLNSKAIEVESVELNEDLLKLINDMVYRGIGGYYGLPYSRRKIGGEEISNQLYRRAAFQLYDRLVAPVHDVLKKEVIFIRSGALSNVPFESLLTSKVTDQQKSRFDVYPYLIKENQITYDFSAAILSERYRRIPPQKINRTAVAFAPFVPVEDASVQPCFSSLEFSGNEVDKVIKEFAGESFLSTGASISNFRANADQYAIVHLATHARTDYDTGDDAYIVFRDSSGRCENLYATDIYGLELSAEMIVLSACKTGTGEERRGEGIISLARAFSFTGSGSVFSTLWNVDDEATNDIVVAFYRELREGVSKDRALHLAKLEYLKTQTTRMQHPFYWSALIGQGDMSPLVR